MKRTSLAALLAVLVLGVSSPPVVADDELPTVRRLATSKKLCERAWPKQEKPRYSINLLCAQYWLFAYNYSLKQAREVGVTEALTLDPVVTGHEVRRFTRGQLLAMAKHVRRLPKKRRGQDNWIAIRAREYFEGAAESKQSLLALGACSGTLDCLIRQIFDNQRLLREQLQALDAMHLYHLRHAVYARHGRRFKDSNLDRLFYTDVAREQSGGLLPRTRKRGYSDAQLTDIDRANIELLQSTESARKKAWSQSRPLFLRE